MSQHDSGTVPGQPLVMGFAGLGTMGEAMALRLAEAGVRLVVWNRTRERCAPLQAAGAEIAPDMATLFARCDPVMLMLAEAVHVAHHLGVPPARLAETLVAGPSTPDWASKTWWPCGRPSRRLSPAP